MNKREWWESLTEEQRADTRSCVFRFRDMKPVNDLIFEILDAVLNLGPSRATGGAIWDRVDEERGIHHSSGEMYTVLHKLRAAGHLTPEKRNGKVYYSITDKGLKERTIILNRSLSHADAIPAK